MPPTTSSTSTARRRKAIRRLLESSQVQSQAQLIDLLAEHGHQTTQPVLSRDLRALNVAKQAGTYQLLPLERVTPLESLSTLLRDVRQAGPHMVVLVCEPGAASAVARALDAEGLEGLVGTVAGDDTVFAALSDPAAGEIVRERVLSLLD